MRKVVLLVLLLALYGLVSQIADAAPKKASKAAAKAPAKKPAPGKVVAQSAEIFIGQPIPDKLKTVQHAEAAPKAAPKAKAAAAAAKARASGIAPAPKAGKKSAAIADAQYKVAHVKEEVQQLLSVEEVLARKPKPEYSVGMAQGRVIELPHNKPGQVHQLLEMKAAPAPLKKYKQQTVETK